MSWNVNFIQTSQPAPIKIDPRSESIIKTVIERCKKEKDNNHLQVPLDDCEERVSYYTGFSKSYIYMISNVVENKNCEDFSNLMILKTMKEAYSNSKYELTYKDIYEKSVNTISKTDLSFLQFKQLMEFHGYGYCRTKGGYIVVVENPKLTFERFHYLNKLKKLRESNSPIFYIDQRLIDSDMQFKTPSVDTNLVLFHMISKNGYENGLFCFDACTEDFFKWIVDIIIPHLPKASTIIMDNNPLHQTQRHPINGYSKKSDMLAWLNKNNIPCNAKMRKAELYQLITKCPVQTEQSYIDGVLKAHGHTILHLPSKFENLSPTDIMWKEIREKAKAQEARNTKQLVVKQRVYEIIMSLPQSQFNKYEQIVIDAENEIVITDSYIEIILERYNFETTNTKSCYCSYDGIED